MQQDHKRPDARPAAYSRLDATLVAAAALLITLAAWATKSFWGDEILSLQFSNGSIPAMLQHLAEDYHPPLYFFLLKSWLALFGDGELGLRLFQGIQTALLLTVTLLLFRQLFPRHRFHPLFLLFLLSTELWLFAPMLRYYTLAAALAVLATSVFLRWLDQPTQRRTVTLLVLYALLFYTDYPSSFVLLIHGVILLLHARQRLGRFVAVATGSALLFLPWLQVLIGQLGKLHGAQQAADFNTSALAIPVKIGFTVYAFIVGENILPVEAAGLAAVAALCLLAIALLLRRRRGPLTRQEAVPFIVLLLAILATSLVTTLVSRHTSFIYTPSRTLYALPFAFLSLAALYDRFSSVSWQRAFVIVLALIAGYGLYNTLSNRHFLMPVYAVPWKTVVADVASTGADAVIVDEAHCYDYYAERSEAPAVPRIAPATPAETAAELRSLAGPTLADDTPAMLCLVTTERESTESEIPASVLYTILGQGTEIEHRRYVPYDETYRFMKQKLLGREPGSAKLHLRTFTIAPPAQP